jgi:hypothetical protein
MATASDRFARSAPGDAQIESLRLPPHSVEAEQAVLGGLLLSNSAWDRIGDVVASRISIAPTTASSGGSSPSWSRTRSRRMS